MLMTQTTSPLWLFVQSTTGCPSKSRLRAAVPYHHTEHTAVREGGRDRDHPCCVVFCRRRGFRSREAQQEISGFWTLDKTEAFCRRSLVFSGPAQERERREKRREKDHEVGGAGTSAAKAAAIKSRCLRQRQASAVLPTTSAAAGCGGKKTRKKKAKKGLSAAVMVRRRSGGGGRRWRVGALASGALAMLCVVGLLGRPVEADDNNHEVGTAGRHTEGQARSCISPLLFPIVVHLLLLLLYSVRQKSQMFDPRQFTRTLQQYYCLCLCSMRCSSSIFRVHMYVYLYCIGTQDHRMQLNFEVIGLFGVLFFGEGNGDVCRRSCAPRNDVLRFHSQGGAPELQIMTISVEDRTRRYIRTSCTPL